MPRVGDVTKSDDELRDLGQSDDELRDRIRWLSKAIQRALRDGDREWFLRLNQVKVEIAEKIRDRKQGE